MVTSIKKILFPTDFSETALNAFRYAIWFANQYDAVIELWHFVAPEIALGDLPMLSGEITQSRIDVAKDVIKTFEAAGISQALKTHQLKKAPNIRTHVAVGPTTQLISEKAKNQSCDLIIMGTQGEHNTIDRIVGSVTTRTIDRAPCPILAIPDHTKTDLISTVAYATNLLESDYLRIWKSVQLLEPFNPSFRIMHAEDSNDKVALPALERIATYFNDEHPSVPITFHPLFGSDPLALLDKFIGNHKIDLMIMYRPKHGFFKQLFSTSMTRQLALHTRTPLLIIK